MDGPQPILQKRGQFRLTGDDLMLNMRSVKFFSQNNIWLFSKTQIE